MKAVAKSHQDNALDLGCGPYSDHEQQAEAVVCLHIMMRTWFSIAIPCGRCERWNDWNILKRRCGGQFEPGDETNATNAMLTSEVPVMSSPTAVGWSWLIHWWSLKVFHSASSSGWGDPWKSCSCIDSAQIRSISLSARLFKTFFREHSFVVVVLVILPISINEATVVVVFNQEGQNFSSIKCSRHV